MRGTRVPAGRQRWRRGRHLGGVEVAVLLVLRLLLHRDVFEADALHDVLGGRRDRVPVSVTLLPQQTAGSQLRGVLAGHQHKPTRRRGRRARCPSAASRSNSTPIVFRSPRTCRLSAGRKRATLRHRDSRILFFLSPDAVP